MTQSTSARREAVGIAQKWIVSEGLLHVVERRVTPESGKTNDPSRRQMSDPAEERNFGFVNSREESELAVTGDDGAIDTVVDAVAILLDWRERSAFRCIAEVRCATDRHEYELTARPRYLSYEVTDSRTANVTPSIPRRTSFMKAVLHRPIDASQLNWEHTWRRSLRFR